MNKTVQLGGFLGALIPFIKVSVPLVKNLFPPLATMKSKRNV